MLYFYLLIFPLRYFTLYNMMLNFALIFPKTIVTNISACFSVALYFKTMCAYRIWQNQGEFQFLFFFLFILFFLIGKEYFELKKTNDLLSINLWLNYSYVNACVAHTEGWHTACEVPVWCGVSDSRVPSSSTNHGFPASPSSSHNWKIRVWLP